MTNSFALYFGAVLVIIAGVDLLYFDLYYTVFWTKKLIDLIEYIAIWR
mgnify:CR=1 FL=1